jgi:hypothetical protein
MGIQLRRSLVPCVRAEQSMLDVGNSKNKSNARHCSVSKGHSRVLGRRP